MKKALEHKSISLSEKVTAWVGSTTSLIIHSILFALSFILIILGVETDQVLLVLTTIVSLEAIYLSIFIQMTVNRNTASLQDVEEDINEIQEDVEEVQKDVEEISEDVEEIQKVKAQTPEETIEHMQKMLEKFTADLELLRVNKKVKK
ncbi:MAG: hypothetical protein COX77_01085 [Candidatus Komeilibacteria bacterium CG_4_10_14_0_2_um_filter_37_10]|uniref:DUF1003 domain-containing protein n=1 Tax=Candidatus Komeilibacteria bacterium CG_4_10_14_0_2_um_filter_37_10 TaxID=1974470 RepID=A0A2M7VG45_9BACT|nr:MAG: hypothetical protein COX77_01085 [Candidatus Komeilibacteria bacterium CG_4_10_14_0_2_um_filter_37_10]